MREQAIHRGARRPDFSASAQQYGQQLIEQIGPDEALPIIVRVMDEAV